MDKLTGLMIKVKILTSELSSSTLEKLSFMPFLIKTFFVGIENTDSIPWAFNNFKAERKKKPVLVSWIHSHVRGAECCFSSIDCHTQHTYEKIHNGILGLVVEIMDNCQKGVHHFFEMTEIGKKTVELCSRRKSCNSREQHESCMGRDLYQSADSKVIPDSFYSVSVTNFIPRCKQYFLMDSESSFAQPMEVEKIPEQMEEDEDLLTLPIEIDGKEATANIDFTQCKNEACMKSVKRSKIIMHIERSKKGCKKAYGTEYQELKAKRDQVRKDNKRIYQQNYNKKNKNSIREQKQTYRKKNSSAIKMRSKIYYETHTVQRKVLYF